MTASAPPGISVHGEELSLPTPARPIWNPNSACNWSALFSPAFGAFIHALNWMALDEPEKARSARVWFYVSLAWLGGVLLLGLMPEQPAQLRYLGVAYLALWYFVAGRRQVSYVKERHGSAYPRRAWGKPLLIAVVSLVGYLVLAVVLTVVTRAVRGA